MHSIVASVLLIIGLTSTGTALWNGQLIAALAIALATAYAVLAWYSGIIDSLTNPIFQLAGAVVILPIGLVAILNNNRALNVDLQVAYSAVLYDLGTMHLHCDVRSAELRKLQEFGVMACAMQGNSDQLGVLNELSKGIHFGPTLTVLDSGAALLDSENPNYCAKTFKAAENLCPTAFMSLKKSYRSALLAAAQ